MDGNGTEGLRMHIQQQEHGNYLLVSTLRLTHFYGGPEPWG
jgi:hypothetical protein